MKKKKSNGRDYPLHLWISDELATYLKRGAAKKGLTLAAYVRVKLSEKARVVLD